MPLHVSSTVVLIIRRSEMHGQQNIKKIIYVVYVYNMKLLR